MTGSRFALIKPWLFTGLRAIACLILVWAFAWSVRPFSISITGTLAMATLASLVVSYELSIRDIRTEWIAATVCTILCCASLGYGAFGLVKPSGFDGPLLAGHDESLPARCAIQFGERDKIAVVLENPPPDKTTVFKLSLSRNCPVLGFHRSGKGLTVSATFYGRDNDLAFQLADNRYESVADLGVWVNRPDESTLQIYDHLGREVFYLRWLNSGTALVRASFLQGG